LIFVPYSVIMEGPPE